MTRARSRGLVGYVRRNFMTPLPVAESFEALNARFLDACTKRRRAILRGPVDADRRTHAGGYGGIPAGAAGSL
ncbi:hypothetical protein [Methylocystis sp. ATCC 49242]|uniref:hypothetical protein n=1 Tax=Methylocystis sp. ATCC 49242 TaxID=622637 RepID=UPI0021104FD9|nr:hypothetical protein [Methylocystis sp. ATCC 49242]